MSGIATRTFTQAFNDARGLLNDVVGDVYTDGVLLPFGALAEGEIQDEFGKEGIPVLEAIAQNFAYLANAATVPITGGLTATFNAPIELWQQPVGGGVWSPVLRGEVIPNPPVFPTTLTSWEWAGGAILVTPCSMNVTVFCRYRIQLAYPAAGDASGGEGFYWPLVYGTAFLAGLATARPQVSVQNLGGEYRKRTADAIAVAKRDRRMVWS